MATTEERPRVAERIAILAAEIDVTPETVVGWIRAGHLQAFAPPGLDIGRRTRGHKTLRVYRDDWDRFVRANTRTGVAPQPDAPAVQAIVGSDGKSRRRPSRAR